jgi:hypothetical protein
MAFADQLLSALSTAAGLKDALGAVLNRCEVGACAKARNLSLGVVCINCGHFCCNAHGFVPLSALPLIAQTKKPVVVCLDCLVVRGEQETP